MPRQAMLLFSTPKGGEQEFVLSTAGETSIGRHHQCTITVAQPSVSRKHARLWFEAGGFYIEDLGSSNGTYVNNQRVTRVSLTDGDALRCGDFKLDFRETEGGTREVEQAPAAPAPAPPPSPAISPKPKVVGTIRPKGRASDAPGLKVAGRLSPRKSKAPGPTSAPPGAPAEGEDAVARLEAEVAHLKAQLEAKALLEGGDAPASAADGPNAAELQKRVEALTTERDAAQRELTELRRDVDDKAGRIAELESTKVRSKEQIDTLTDRQRSLREQVQAQQNQLEEYRREKIELEVGLGETRQRAGDLENALKASSAREAELADDVNDLKREVQQKKNENREIQRQLELAEYNLDAVRSENENLRLALTDDDAARKGLNTTIDHLKQVNEEKEAMIDRLQGELSRVEQRLSQAEATAREAGGARAAALDDALRTLEGDLAEAKRENEALQAQLAGRSATPARNLVEQLNELKRANRDLRNALDEARASGGGGAAGPDPRVAALEQRLQAAEAALADAESRAASTSQAPAAAPADGSAVIEDAVPVFEALNDLASGLKTDMQLVQSYVGDLAPVVEAACAPGFEGPAAVRLKAAVEDADAQLTLEQAREALSDAAGRARDIKKQMRAFRDLLSRHGYGS
jgi:predicted  nucleic acid-binding Zn-ribbon protein